MTEQYIDSIDTEEITCPYCGYDEHDKLLNRGNIIKCSECRSKFRYYEEIIYTTIKVEDND